MKTSLPDTPVTNQPSETGEDEATPVAPLRLGRTLRLALRGVWDTLGTACAASFVVFLAALPGISLFLAGLSRPLPARAAFWLGGLGALALLAGPAFAGVCRFAHRVYQHDEPSLADVFRGARDLAARAAALAAIHLVGLAVLLANVGFYLRFRGIWAVAAVVLFLYLLLFGLMAALYHWPLLVAADEGILKREDGSRSGLKSVLRNGFLLAVSAPGASAACVLLLLVLSVPLLISGAGFAVLFPAVAAFVAARAARDQLIRFGLMPPDPDPEAPVSDDPWRMRG